MSFLNRIGFHLGINTGLIRNSAPPLLAFVLFRTFIIDWFQVPTSSMAPTIYRGDFVLVAKYAYGYSPLSIVLNLGTWLLPRKVRYDDDGRPLQVNLLANNKIRAGNVPYIKLASIKPGHIVCLTDPRINGICMTKRVAGVSGDVVRVTENILYRNGKACPQKFLGEHFYRHDFGDVYTEELFEEHLVGTSVKHIVQYRKGYKKCNTVTFAIPDPVIVITLFGQEVEREYIWVLGNNRDGSSDSRHGEIMLHYIPEDWVIGSVLGVICSTHLNFARHAHVSHISISWPEYLSHLPWNAMLNARAIILMPERIGLIIDQPHRSSRPVNSLMRLAFGEKSTSDNFSDETSTVAPDDLDTLVDDLSDSDSITRSESDLTDTLSTHDNVDNDDSTNAS